MAMKKRMGRRRIPIKLIASRSARHVSFSKRRSGIFKKASELSMLTGAHLAIIVFSPGGKPYSFGHPCVGLMTNRFVNVTPPLHRSPYSDGAVVSALSQQYNDLVERLDAEKKRGEKAKEEFQKQMCSSMQVPLNQLNYKQLVEHKMVLEKLSEKVAKRRQELLLEGSVAKPSSPKISLGLIDLNVAYPPEMETSGSP